MSLILCTFHQSSYINPHSDTGYLSHVFIVHFKPKVCCFLFIELHISALLVVSVWVLKTQRKRYKFGSFIFLSSFVNHNFCINSFFYVGKFCFSIVDTFRIYWSMHFGPKNFPLAVVVRDNCSKANRPQWTWKPLPKQISRRWVQVHLILALSAVVHGVAASYFQISIGVTWLLSLFLPPSCRLP